MAKQLPLTHLNVTVGGNSIAKTLIVQDEDKALRDTACSITGKKTKNLVVLAKEDGSEIIVSMEVLRKAEVSQKDIDRIYNVGYFDGKTGVKKDKANVVEALAKFLA
jgi:hypothetical protein